MVLKDQPTFRQDGSLAQAAQLKDAPGLVYQPHPEHLRQVGEAQANPSVVKPPGRPKDPSQTQEQGLLHSRDY